MSDSNGLHDALEDALSQAQKGVFDPLAALVAAHSDAVVKSDLAERVVLAAVYNGKREIVDALIPKRMSWSASVWAAAGEYEALENILAEDPEAADVLAPDGFAPLHLAAFFGGPETMDVLVEAGADIHQAADNPMKVLPLNSAVAAGQIACVTILVDAGADVNAPQQQNITPLMSAAAGGHRDILHYLVVNGADRDARSDDGKTAADYARERGHDELADFLDNWRR